MQYIISEPFPGYAETVIREDGTVMYTKLTLDDYLAQGKHLRVVDESEIEALMEAHHDSLVTRPVVESLEDWNDALNVLPPCRWQTYAGIEFFHISERLTGNLVAWHARIGDKCWAFTDYASRPFDELAEKVSRITNNA